MSSSDPPAHYPDRPVLYLTKRFPRLSETFILDEILGLEAAGVPLRLYAVADPAERLVQPDVSRVASPVGYLRSGHGWRAAGRDYRCFVRCHLTLLRQQPGRWLALVAHIVVARRHLSTLRHFAEAGRLAVEAERTGAGHLHAAFAHGPASVAHFVHQLTGIPFSFAAHAKDLYLSAPDLLARKVAASSFVLACSQSSAAELRRIVAAHPDPAVQAHQDKVILAPHGVDVERFRPAPPAARPLPSGALEPSGALRVLAVGRLVAKKGYPVLLAALADLAAAGVDVECRVVGAGPLRAELAEAVARLGLAHRVTFCGSRTQPQITAEYRRAQVFVHASVITADGDRDGIPNSLLEAMASGLPVIASAVAGIPEVLLPGLTGVLVPPADPPALAAALQALAADPALRARLGQGARTYVVEHLSRPACISVVAELLRGPAPAALPGPSRVA